MKQFRLDGRRAVVTGGSRGIGRAISLALADAGAHVTAVARERGSLESLQETHRGIEGWSVDVCDPGFADQLAQRDVDILVNNAGTNAPMPMETVPTDVLDQILNLNVRSVYLASQGAVRGMLRHGRGGVILNITSQMGHVGSPNRSVYCMTKHAIEGLTKAMAVEFAARGIRVNAIAPTFIETDLTRPMLENEAFRRFVVDMIPIGRTGTPEDVAAAAVYLASPAASLVTGTSLLVDGGWTAR